ncbi:MAG TPA: hypothetical protein VIW24_19390 [Aldersonia sp.]
MTVQAPAVEVPAGARKSIERFAADHGGSAEAVLQPIGEAGVRITLVGADGILGDRVVKDLPTAHAVIDAIPSVTVAEEWTRELSASATPRPGHWAKMAGWVARQTSGFPRSRNER